MSPVRFHLDIFKIPFDFVAESMDLGSDMLPEEKAMRVLIEKKTVLNLIDAFCVSVKHYLRGEEGTLFIGVMRVSTMSNSTSSQASTTWICSTQSDIFHHTFFPRACHPRLTSQPV
jgi:hypothetical protein